MTEKLTIKAKDQQLDIDTNRADIAAAFIRSIVGVAPIVGPLVAEIITATIPNQKLERIVISIRVLEDRLKYVEEDVIRGKFKTDTFTDLLEDAFPQMARALTDERKGYIANLLANSLTDDTLNHLAQKKLLSLLNELNDAEIILLHFYAVRQADEEKAAAMLKEYPFIQEAITHKPETRTEEDLMFREYHGTLIMTSLIMGPVEKEHPSPTGYLLLKYIQPDKTSCG